MRVTDSSAYTTMRKHVMRAREDLASAQERAGSGLRVQKPSDDPVAASAARREHGRKALAEAGLKSTEYATMQLEGADEALGDVYEALTEVRARALESVSTTFGDENRRAAAIEVRKIRDQMVAIGNTNVAGRYIFAGYRDQQPAFEASGEFVGDLQTKELQALPGLRVTASITGQEAFGAGTESSVFATLDKLASALEENDTDAIRATLDDIDASQERVLSARTQVGAMINGVTMAKSVADRHGYRAELEITRLTETDEISAVTDLLQAKGVLEKALSVAQQIPVGSLAGGR